MQLRVCLSGLVQRLWLPTPNCFHSCNPSSAGQMLEDNLRHCLLAPEKLRSELRASGHASLAEVFAVVLEPTGTFAVITNGACWWCLACGVLL